MPRRRDMSGAPASYVRSGAWPHAHIDDVAAAAAQNFAARLASATEGLSLRQVEARTGVSYTTVRDVLTGVSWANIVTLARLEAGLRADLWHGTENQGGSQPGISTAIDHGGGLATAPPEK